MAAGELAKFILAVGAGSNLSRVPMIRSATEA
jgi:hypothetical protein